MREQRMRLEEKNPENFFIRMIYLYVSPNLKQRIEIDSNIMFFLTCNYTVTQSFKSKQNSFYNFNSYS